MRGAGKPGPCVTPHPEPPSRHLVFLIGEDWFFASHFRARARAAQQAGWRVSILTRTASAAAASLRDDGFAVIGVDFVRARLDPVAELRLLRSIARHYRALQPDIVHHVALKPILLGSIAARLAKVRRVVNAPVGQGFVFSSHSLRARLLRPWVGLALRATIGARGAVAVFENKEDRAAMIASGAIALAQTALIQGAGVDIALFAPRPTLSTMMPSTATPSKTVQIILGARMLRDKGVREFIAAAKILQAQGVTANFLLAGAPDPGNPAALSEAELHDAAPVRWLGPVADMAALLVSCDIACLPSYREGMPKFLLEAMASGLACVATNVTGCREAVLDGETGLLVPARDAPALAASLARLIGDADLRTRMGMAGRERVVSMFSEAAVCGQTLALYQRMIEQETTE
ncbi:MAG TPA: glycosyltransferase family 4 protein [Acidiphilium sp.]|nr:MAG: glycosyl transferase family 1 [Acidiphilium sp. 21-60-14]OYV90098.1 MAG: glycosyl transferase family 1 [Acidiphilium sp. 37-60-79]OZB39426.1 MAG: glycosyl transferase family 1 [Acidiphilium sp. 34-60-192]HQT88246.1 glycosyltransferase family 4 protein [Acidiphilium sp.]HQU23452.1 glycosyltransferase family 4 protein [Acidiphilium sp.]